jgi:hypothetical protein
VSSWLECGSYDDKTSLLVIRRVDIRVGLYNIYHVKRPVILIEVFSSTTVFSFKKLHRNNEIVYYVDIMIYFSDL